MTSFGELDKDAAVIIVMLDWINQDQRALRSLIDYILSLDSLYSGEKGTEVAGRAMNMIHNRHEFYTILEKRLR